MFIIRVLFIICVLILLRLKNKKIEEVSIKDDLLWYFFVKKYLVMDKIDIFVLLFYLKNMIKKKVWIYEYVCI